MQQAGTFDELPHLHFPRCTLYQEGAMQFSSKKERTAIFIGIGLVAALLIFAMISNYTSTNLYTASFNNLVEKKATLNQMRVSLLKSVEMEKSAVMAITDEESTDFANQSRLAATDVEHKLAHMKELNAALPSPEDEKLLTEFSTCWQELTKLDTAILEIAVQNANLKAASLSKNKGAKVLQDFEELLNAVSIQNQNAPDAQKIEKLLYAAMVSSMKIYALHAPHIAEATDAVMDTFEQQMKKEEGIVSNALQQLAGMVQPEAQKTVARAAQKFSEFQDLTRTIITLSRENSNIKSLELSLGAKRKIAARCDELLAQLIEINQAKSLKPRK